MLAKFVPAIGLLIFLLGCGADDDQLSDEITPASEIQEEYGLYCGTYQQIEIDPNNVPADLRDLIPYAEKWGIGDDIVRFDCEEEASEQDKRDLQNALRGRTQAVEDWLDSGPGDAPPNDEAGLFLYMLLALDEMGLWPEP